jgi:hypothetical protein
VREEHVGDPSVVVDHLALREPGLGPQHLVEVGQLEPVPVDVYLAALVLLRDRDLDLEVFERDRDLDAVEGLLRLPLPSPPVASGSPRTAARLSSNAAMRSGVLVGLGSSETGSTTDSP